MATPLYLAKSQFLGELHIDFGNYEDFNNFAVYIEKKYIKKLLGYYHFLKLYVVNISEDDDKNSRYTYILDGLISGWEDDSGILQELAGIKEMLKYFFYCEYFPKIQDRRTLSGDAQETYVAMINGAKFGKNLAITDAWNRGVDIYNQTIDYMKKVDSDTPDTYGDQWNYQTLEKINVFGILT